jgi:hypothetical protein
MKGKVFVAEKLKIRLKRDTSDLESMRLSSKI